MRGKSGKIISFYSYKGGTGRTMALSNLAWVLASNGYDVLLIDWDLEAPGLHRYLRKFLIDPELSATPGLIDYVWEAVRVSMTPGDELHPSSVDFPQLEDYVVGIDWDFPSGGSMAFVPAGQQDANYAQRVNTFDWDRFYERLGGGKLLQAERDILRSNYDFILIDSRTGVSDTSSICTVQMPDQLVVLFTLNRQSIRGASAVAASVRAQRGDSLPIYPVPTRIEDAETDKARLALAYARRRFVGFLQHVQANGGEPNLDGQADYWSSVRTSYRAYYAFEEVPAAFKDVPGERGTVLDATEQLARWLTGLETHLTIDNILMTGKNQTIDSIEKRRNEVVQAYAFNLDEDDLPRTWSPAPTRIEIGWLTRLVRRELRPHRRQYAILFVLVFLLLATWAVIAWNYAYRQLSPQGSTPPATAVPQSTVSPSQPKGTKQ
jgi:hypothetical protein